METKEKIIDVFIQSVSDYRTTTETYNNKQYLVVPVVMMVEGVHDGSHGKVLHRSAELAQSVPAWEGHPITINHPRLNGRFVSAHTPGVANSYHVGLIRNARMDGDKLKAEAWIDPQRLAALSTTGLQMIQSNTTIEVSVGVFTDDTQETGNWHGEQYNLIARNHVPDHLALLPDGVGACSITDGCGIRVNNQKKGGEENVTEIKTNSITKELLEVVTYQPGMSAMVDNMRRKLDSMDTDQQIYFLEEVWESHVVYRVRNRNTNEVKFYKHPYQLEANGQINFVGDKQEVRRDVEYVTLTNNSMERGDKKCEPCIKAKVDALIANEQSKFTEDNREVLEGMTEDTLDLLEPTVVEVKVNAEPKEKKKEVTLEVNSDASKPTKDQAIQVLRETIKSTDDFMKIVPEEMRDQLESGLALHKRERNDLIAKISAYENNAFTKEELEGMDTEKLKKVAGMVKIPVDYSINGGRTIHDNANVPEEILVPTGVKLEE